MRVLIRKIGEKDFGDINKLFIKVDEYHRINLSSIFEKKENIGRTIEYLKNICNSEESELFVAEYDSEIVGIVEINIRRAVNNFLKKDREWVSLDTIMIKEKYRNNGIGEMLVDTVLDWSREKNINRIELNVYEFNKNAIKFYQRLGFETLNRTMYIEI